jgi:predicted metal-binding membrane protein
MTPAARERWQVQEPVLLITLSAWVVLVTKPGGVDLGSSCCLPKTAGMAFSSVSIHQLAARNPPASLALGWGLMLTAMMLPMLVAPLRHVLDRSFIRRRARAVLLFVAGYTAIWMAAGILLIAVSLAVRLLTPESYLPGVLAAIIALIWQCSPFKQRCLNRGHNHSELAAFGTAADLDAIRFGATHGIWCVGSCWALMLLPELFPRGHIAVMAAVTLWLNAERFDRPMPPRWRLRREGKAARIVAVKARMLLQRS